MNELLDFLQNLESLNENSGDEITFSKEDLIPVVITKDEDESDWDGGNPGGGKSPKMKASDKIEVHKVKDPSSTKKKKSNSSGQNVDGVEVVQVDPEDSDGGDPKDSDKKNKKGDKGKDAGKVKQREEGRDSHEILAKSDAAEAKDIAEEIFKRAQEARDREGRNRKSDGSGGDGTPFLDKLKGIYTPRTDWIRELKGKLGSFLSRTAQKYAKLDREIPALKTKKGYGNIKDKDYNNYWKNPKSHMSNDLIFKGEFTKAAVSEVIIIFALDVSGSIGESTLKKAFGELDSIAYNLNRGISVGGRKLTGRVYILTWDIEVTGVELYTKGGYKQYMDGGSKNFSGQRGNDIKKVFEWVESHTSYDKEKNSRLGIMNILKEPTKTGMDKDDVIVPFTRDGKPAVLPYILVATDGQYHMSESDLGDFYKDNHDSILYLLIGDFNTHEHIVPKNYIEYENYRI